MPPGAGAMFWTLFVSVWLLRFMFAAFSRFREERNRDQFAALNAEQRDFYAVASPHAIGRRRVILRSGRGGLEQPEEHPHVRRRRDRGPIADAAKREVEHRNHIDRGIPFQLILSVF